MGKVDYHGFFYSAACHFASSKDLHISKKKRKVAISGSRHPCFEWGGEGLLGMALTKRKIKQDIKAQLNSEQHFKLNDNFVCNFDDYDNYQQVVRNEKIDFLE